MQTPGCRLWWALALVRHAAATGYPKSQSHLRSSHSSLPFSSPFWAQNLSFHKKTQNKTTNNQNKIKNKPQQNQTKTTTQPNPKIKQPTNVFSLLEEEEDHHRWQISDTIFRAQGSCNSVCSIWDKNLSRMEVGEETTFFQKIFANMPLQITDVYHRNTQAVASGWRWGSSSHPCSAESEPTSHHNAACRAGNLSNRTPAALSEGQL